MKRGFLTLVTAILVVGCGPSPSPVAPGAQPLVPSQLPSQSQPHLQPSSRTPAASQPRPSPPLLRLGSQGAAVRRLQMRLQALDYWLGRPDGTFSDATQQAVYAIQKAAGLRADGVVGRRTRAALALGIVPPARSRSGHVVEIDLARDLLLIVDDGVVTTTLNTSTGGGYVYVVDGVTGVAHTPTGRFRIYSQIDGLRISRLGVLWRPKYFYQGYAIHGSPSVPPFPASHGCVRLSNAAIDWIWAAGLMPIGTAVWVY